MNHYDKQILEAQQEEKRRGHRTLETGIYVDDELITFEKITLPDTKIQMFLPMQATVHWFYGHHFGIIGVDETMVVDEVVVF